MHHEIGFFIVCYVCKQHFLSILHNVFFLCKKIQYYPFSLKPKCCGINTLPIDKILDLTKMKVFADDNLNVTNMMISVYDRIENTMGKGEKAGYQHFLRISHSVFQSLLL